MTDFNSQHNRAVWFDIPVADLARAAKFYEAVLAIKVEREESDGFAFCVFEHDRGNGGCLVPDRDAVSDRHGVLVYLNAEGRIRAACEQVGRYGGRIVREVHAIGPHGFRAIVRDSEGNRIALHSSVDG